MNILAQDLLAALAHASHVSHSQGWVPATSGNFSVRLASGMVAITHSINATMVSLQAADCVRIQGLELLKAFRGIDSHETILDIPVFANTQDIDRLAEAVVRHMQAEHEAGSYQKIQQELSIPASDLLFLSDIKAELGAARESGLATVLVARAEDSAPSESMAQTHHQVVDSFDQIEF